MSDKLIEVFESIESQNPPFDLQKHGGIYADDATRKRWDLFKAAYEIGYKDGTLGKSSFKL